MGITRFGQLFDLPAAYLAKRFGTLLPSYLARLAGTRADPRVNVVPSPSFRTSLHLLEPVIDKETLSFPMQRLVNELNGWLVGRALGVSRLLWHFSALHGTPVSLDIELTEPQQNRKNLLTVSRFELERLDLPDEILSIGLDAPRLEPWEERSNELLASPGTATGSISPGHLIDQLKARLGPAACRSLEALDDHRPERAWRQVTPTLYVRRGAHSTAQPEHKPSRRRTPERPLWLLPEPRSVTRQQLRLIRGPERIETGWWDGKTLAGIDRHYYVARLTNGARCWVFTDSKHTDWYLHGYFA
jgi:protein ImuB